MIAHWIAARPPVATSVVEYKTPEIPSGSGDVEVISIGGGETVRRNGNDVDARRLSLFGLVAARTGSTEAVPLGPLSVSVTLKSKLPSAVGVPLSTPVDDNVTHGGSDPALTPHVVGTKPPVSVSGSE